LTIVVFLLRRDEAADESGHRVIPLQLDDAAGRWVPEAFAGRSKSQTAL
jgi:hypothetical protein